VAGAAQLAGGIGCQPVLGVECSVPIDNPHDTIKSKFSRLSNGSAALYW
jgi:hypothetical protein